MNFLKRTFVTVILLLFYCGLNAQQNIITTAVPFLMITPDARAGALGETGVASSPDIYSMHWNVAKLAFAEKKFGAGLSYTPWLRALVPNIDHSYLSMYMKPDSISAFVASVRYFSLGTVIIGSGGGTIGQYRPYEFAVDFGYTRRIAKYWSLGMAGRLIRSNLTNGISIGNQSSFVGQVFAVDLSTYYFDRDRVKILGYPCIMMMGAALTNVGSKIKYSGSVSGDFIPINLRIGQGFRVDFDSYNSLSLQYEFNKLLVPTPPVYQLGPNGSPMMNSSGQYVILAGKDPNVSVPKGMLQSFNDAPGGKSEELAEITFGTGLEYWYNNIFAVRAGYFYEAPTKGNRQFVTLGAGIKYNFVSLDFCYLLPTNGQRSPLQNTLRFSLQFQFDRFKNRPPNKKP